MPLNYERYLPKTKYKIIEEINELKNIFMSYEKTKESYGLIHSDIHAGNFFVNNNDIFLYDFDDSCYHWYIYDIATIIYSYVSGLKDNEDKIFYGKNFVHNFLESYFSINNLDKKWLNILSELIRFRDLLIYDFLYKKWDINNLNERQKKHFDKLDLRINKKIPLIDIEKILY